jgi:hypothetical protein
MTTADIGVSSTLRRARCLTKPCTFRNNSVIGINTRSLAASQSCLGAHRDAKGERREAADDSDDADEEGDGNRAIVGAVMRDRLPVLVLVPSSGDAAETGLLLGVAVDFRPGLHHRLCQCHRITWGGWIRRPITALHGGAASDGALATALPQGWQRWRNRAS